MSRPRKDYIVLSSADATAVDNSYRWNIQPHMFRNYLPGDQMMMRLMSSQFEAPIAGANNLYSRSIAVMSDVICNNQEVMGAGKSTLAIVPGYYEDSGAGGILTPSKTGISPELYIDRFNSITISCWTDTQLDITSTTAPASGVARFLLEINYYRDEQA
jgi:hypothetical protein